MQSSEHAAMLCGVQTAAHGLTKIFLQHKLGDLCQMLGLQFLRQSQLVSHLVTFLVAISPCKTMVILCNEESIEGSCAISPEAGSW